MSINLPLKIKDTFGNLQQLTTSEENYLAYQLGLNLSESVDSDVAALTLNDSISNLTVGTFTDTFYNEPVGTNPGTSLSIGNSTTTLYQTAGIADSSGSEWRIPVGFKESDGSFREMPPSSFDSLIDRLVQKVLINDFPGAYRLDSAGFSDTDWQPQLTDVFIDTQTDSTNKNYNIFQRKSITAPDEIKHMSIKRDGGRTGSFQGIQETTVAQIKYTLGQRAKTYIVESGIGTYKLRTSGEGVPTPGTWVAKGIAVDTRKTTADADYSKQYIGSYEESVDKSFTGQYTGNRFFGGQVNKSFTGQYTGNRFFGRQVNKSFTGQYTGNRFFGRQVNKSFTGQYTGNRFFGGQVNKSFTGQYTGARSFLGFRQQNFTGTRQFTGTRTSTFVGFFQRSYKRENISNFSSQFTGTRQFTGIRQFTGLRFFSPDAKASYGGLRSFSRTGQFAGTRQFTSPQYQGGRPQYFTGTVSEQYVGTRTSQFSGARSFSGIRSFYFTGLRTFSRTYVGQYTRQFTGLRTFSRTYVGQYTRQFTGLRTFSRTYVGQYTRQFVSSAQFSRIYIGQYTRQFVSSAQFSRIYIGQYTKQYLGAYEKQYAGETIQSSSEIIETYTLYVRTS